MAVTLLISIAAGISCALQLRDAVAFQHGAMETAALRARTLGLQLDEETGVRGYAASRLPVLLEPFTAAEREIEGAFSALDRATLESGVPGSPELIADMVRRHRIWLKSVAGPLISGHLSPRDSGRVQLNGKRQIDAYRTDNELLAAAISLNFRRRMGTTERQFERVAVAFIASVVLCVFAVGISARRMQLEIDRARAAALLREDAIRFEQSRSWLRAFQAAILPPRLPSIPGCTFDAVYQAGENDAHIGGDWYDAVRLVDGRILVSIGDVAGSGIEAAVVMGSMRQIMRGIAQVHADPALMLDAADRALRLEYADVFVTAWVGIIDLVTQTLTYASAGHPPPIVAAVDGSLRELGETALPLGLRTGHQEQPSMITLSEGSTIVMYTDGLSEATRDVVAGDALVRAATRMVSLARTENPAAAIHHHVLPDGARDDVAILVVRMNFGEVEQHIERCTFEVGNIDQARRARGVFIAALERHNFSEIERLNGELVFGELLGNVIRHVGAGENVEIAIDSGTPQIVLHVLDRGPSFRHISRLPSNPYSENGRGLFLIASLTDEFTVTERPDGGSHVRAVFGYTSSIVGSSVDCVGASSTAGTVSSRRSSS